MVQMIQAYETKKGVIHRTKQSAVSEEVKLRVDEFSGHMVDHLRHVGAYDQNEGYHHVTKYIRQNFDYLKHMIEDVERLRKEINE